MKKLCSLFLIFGMLFAFTACSNSNSNENESVSTQSTESTTQAVQSETDTQPDTTTESKVLVAYFSRADENYGVGNIEKGNTEIIAEIIANKTGADLFEIKKTTQYPTSYDECTEVAKQEQRDNARPELTATVDNWDDYDTIYLGYPIWWGDLPMPVYTFIESYDWNGKTVIPFCTHAGSGLSSTETTIQEKCQGATVKDGLAIAGTTAQNDSSESEKSVEEWLAE